MVDPFNRHRRICNRIALLVLHKTPDATVDLGEGGIWKGAAVVMVAGQTYMSRASS